MLDVHQSAADLDHVAVGGRHDVQLGALHPPLGDTREDLGLGQADLLVEGPPLPTRDDLGHAPTTFRTAEPSAEGAARVAGMDLPVMPPVRPMLAKSVKGIPDPAKHTVGDITGLSFEPKWDGFRCLVFKDVDEVELASRNTKPLSRYFPEVVAAMQEQLPARCVLDGEVFVALRD